MPGKAWLAANEYYAHPQNVFWRVVGELFDIPVGVGYQQRLQTLTRNRIALWDVLKTCTRASSLDSDIVESSIVVNDLVSFLAVHRQVRRVFFNGAKAEASFRWYVAPDMPDKGAGLEFVRLPSTSPANASWSWERKLTAWRDALL